MPETVSQQIIDEYDLGNTDIEPDQVTVPAVLAAETPASSASPGQAQPRNPDGTFASPATPEGTNPRITHPASLVEAATTYGFSDSEIAALPTDQLHAQVWRMHKVHQGLRQQMDADRAKIADTQRKEQPVAPVPAIDPEEEELLTLEREGLDPRLTKFLKLSRSAKKELEELKAHVQEREQRDQKRVISGVDAMVEDGFAALGDSFKKIFGTGTLNELGENSPAAKRRFDVVRSAGIDINTDSAATIKKKITAAANSIYSDMIDQAVIPAVPAAPSAYGAALNGKQANGTTPSKEDWNQAGLRRPTSREVEELPPGEERAIRNLAKKMGADVGAVPDSVEKDGFLPD